MTKQDSACSLHPYWKIHEGQQAAFNGIVQQFVDKTNEEEGVLYYGFTFNGDEAFCREAYADAEGVLAYLANVGPILEEALKIADITRLEMHGPESELGQAPAAAGGAWPAILRAWTRLPQVAFGHSDFYLP